MMQYAILADLVILIHVGFVVFVVFGGFLALRWRWLPWIHIPSALWGIALEFGGWICPLTHLENRLREAGGRSAYEADFIGQYIIPLLYPPGLSHQTQLVLGLGALAVNVAAYACVWRSMARCR